jgi:exodeoxyribonuclease VII small subunit
VDREYVKVCKSALCVNFFSGSHLVAKTKEENSEQPSFEQSLKRLEEIVHLLEEGDLGLNDALQRYEEGVKLLRQSYDLLQKAERRIELLSGVDAEGNPITQPFDDTATVDMDEKPRRRKSN